MRVCRGHDLARGPDGADHQDRHGHKSGYIAGAMAYFLAAHVVLDAFHIMSQPQAGSQPKAARRVRRSRINMADWPSSGQGPQGTLARQGGDLPGGVWALRGNTWTRNSNVDPNSGGAYPALGRAVVLREFLQNALAGSDRAQPKG